MKSFIKRLKKAPWSYKQPLTKVPNYPRMPVSDLFVWRCSSDWNTFFELTDIAGMFDDELEVRDQFVIICLFDRKGTLFHEEKHQIQRHKKITLDISTFLSKTKSSVGTFCIFHSHTPYELVKLGSFLAERGYLSYTYKNSPIRSFVHGNLDAIARLPGGEKQLLGTRSFLSRKYNLQHQLLGPANYDIAIVNPTFSALNLTCSILSSDNNIIDVQSVQILPCGVGFIPIYVDESQAYRLIITSHLVMARPLVFCIHNKNMLVFHG